MALYELGLILDAELESEAREAFLAELREMISAGKASIVKEDVWGKRTLAYEIKHKREGFYIFWQFEGDGAVIRPLEYKLRLSEQALRYLTLNLDVEMRRKKKFDAKRAEQKARKRSLEAAAAEQRASEEA